CELPCWRVWWRLPRNRTESSRHWSRAKQAANSYRSCQTSVRQGFYEVLAKGGFQVVVIADGRGDQIEFEDSFHMGIPFALPAVCIPFLVPESDGDPLFRLGLGHEGQELHKSPLLLQDRQNLFAENVHDFVFHFRLGSKFNDAAKHDESPLRSDWGDPLGETISNSPHDACSVCGSRSLINLFRMLDGKLRSQKPQSAEDHAKPAKYNLELTVKVHEIPALDLNRVIESISRLAEVSGVLESLHINVEPVFDMRADGNWSVSPYFAPRVRFTFSRVWTFFRPNHRC